MAINPASLIWLTSSSLLKPPLLFAPAADWIDSIWIVPSISSAPKSCATMARLSPKVAQYALICGILWSKILAMLIVFRISCPVGKSVMFKKLFYF